MSDLAWTDYVLVAFGGAAGASLRYVAGHFWDQRRGLPFGTIAVNLGGSLLLGLLAGLDVVGAVAALTVVGLCGALTTYSSFVVQAHDRGPRLGTLVVLLTTVPAVLLYAGGVRLGQVIG